MLLPPDNDALRRKAAEAVIDVVLVTAAAEHLKRSVMMMPVVMVDPVAPRRGPVWPGVVSGRGTVPFDMMPWGGSSASATSSASAGCGERRSAKHQAGKNHCREYFECLVHSTPSLSSSV
jgi:hypothetical protein